MHKEAIPSELVVTQGHNIWEIIEDIRGRRILQFVVSRSYNIWKDSAAGNLATTVWRAAGGADVAVEGAGQWGMSR